MTDKTETYTTMNYQQQVLDRIKDACRTVSRAEMMEWIPKGHKVRTFRNLRDQGLIKSIRMPILGNYRLPKYVVYVLAKDYEWLYALTYPNSRIAKQRHERLAANRAKRLAAKARRAERLAANPP